MSHTHTHKRTFNICTFICILCFHMTLIQYCKLYHLVRNDSDTIRIVFILIVGIKFVIYYNYLT